MELTTDDESSTERLRELAAGYSKVHRVIEVLSIILFLSLEAYLAFRLNQVVTRDTFLHLLIAAFLGYLGADFVSGFLHWAADSWGNVHWPLVGQSLIRTFREHHLDPKSITRHDFIETNGDICLAGLPFLFIAAFIPLNTKLGLFGVSFLTFQCLFGSFTNQIHKWSHMNAEEVPRIVAHFQNSGLILSRKAHNRHHAPPYARDYCITSGVLNRPLGAIYFFHGLEKLIHKLTGAIPREDDLGRDAALEYARKHRILN